MSRFLTLQYLARAGRTENSADLKREVYTTIPRIRSDLESSFLYFCDFENK